MATNFPTNLDTKNADYVGGVDHLGDTARHHDGRHNDLEDRTIALETKVGKNNSGVATTLDFLIKSTSGGHDHDGSSSRKTALERLIDAKGDLIAGSAADTGARVPAGTNRYVLVFDSTQSAGMIWSKVSTGVTVMVAATDASAAEKALAHYLCDGTSDEVEIHAARDDVVGANAGAVLLLGRTFTIGSEIRLKANVALHGESMYGTQIKAAAAWSPGAETGMVILDTVNVDVTELCDLYLNGNSRPNLDGIRYDNTAGTFGLTSPDPAHLVERILIQNTSKDGAYFGANTRAIKVNVMRVLNAGQDGVSAQGPDAHYHEIDSGSAGRYGVNVGGTNQHWTNSKAWFASDSGWVVSGTRNYFAACDAQDNDRHGFEITAGRNTFAACTADSNNRTGTKSGRGVKIDASYVAFQGVSLDRAVGGQTPQTYGIELVSGNKGLIIDIVTYGNASGSVTGTRNLAHSTIRIVGTDNSIDSSEFRFRGGQMYLSTPATAPTDAQLGASQIAPWLDETAGELTVRTADSASALTTRFITRRLPLAPPTAVTYVSHGRADTISNSAALTSGTLYLFAIWLPRDFLITSLSIRVGTTAWTGLTHGWLVLYDSALARLRQATDSATSWTANVPRVMALSSTFTTTYTGLHYIGACAVGTVGTVLGSASNANWFGEVPIVAGTADTGLNTGTAPNPAAALTAIGTYAAVGVV